jgi:hypothetical protein
MIEGFHGCGFIFNGSVIDTGMMSVNNLLGARIISYKTLALMMRSTASDPNFASTILMAKFPNVRRIEHWAQCCRATLP